MRFRRIVVLCGVFINFISLSAAAQTLPTTPNLHLPLISDGYLNWGVPYRQTMTLLDNWSLTVAPLASPSFTGTPIAPTATVGTNTTQVATTAFVQAAVNKIANVLIVLPTTTLTANSCTSVTATPMPGVIAPNIPSNIAGSAFSTSFTADVSGVTGWGAVGGLTWIAWPTTDTVNWKVCNVTASSITPGAATLNVGAK